MPPDELASESGQALACPPGQFIRVWDVAGSRFAEAVGSFSEACKAHKALLWFFGGAGGGEAVSIAVVAPASAADYAPDAGVQRVARVAAAARYGSVGRASA